MHVMMSARMHTYMQQACIHVSMYVRVYPCVCSMYGWLEGCTGWDYRPTSCHHRNHEAVSHGHELVEGRNTFILAGLPLSRRQPEAIRLQLKVELKESLHTCGPTTHLELAAVGGVCVCVCIYMYVCRYVGR